LKKQENAISFEKLGTCGRRSEEEMAFPCEI
jgi:hypothetical protein